MVETRAISWVKAARKAFEAFPDKGAHARPRSAHYRRGRKQGRHRQAVARTGSGVLEIVLNDRSGTYRVVYAVRLGDDLWVLRAFQKKSKTGIKTPLGEIEVVRQRLKRLKELLS